MEIFLPQKMRRCQECQSDLPSNEMAFKSKWVTPLEMAFTQRLNPINKLLVADICIYQLWTKAKYEFLLTV